MKIFVLSKSDSVIGHIQASLPKKVNAEVIHSVDELKDIGMDNPLVLIHADSFQNSLNMVVKAVSEMGAVNIAIATNEPLVEELLKLSEWEIKAYFNSYMADIHYRQMINMVDKGQNWFHPSILQEIIKRASLSITEEPEKPNNIDQLTKREKQIAQTVAEGLSNKEISVLHGISERTVKAHLTHIFDKLEVKDRVGLAIMLNNYFSAQKKLA